MWEFVSHSQLLHSTWEKTHISPRLELNSLNSVELFNFFKNKIIVQRAIVHSKPLLCLLIIRDVNRLIKWQVCVCKGMSTSVLNKAQTSNTNNNDSTRKTKQNSHLGFCSHTARLSKQCNFARFSDVFGRNEL